MISSSVRLAMLVEVSREPILIARPPQLPPVAAASYCTYTRSQSHVVQNPEALQTGASRSKGVEISTKCQVGTLSGGAIVHMFCFSPDMRMHMLPLSHVLRGPGGP